MPLSASSLRRRAREPSLLEGLPATSPAPPPRPSAPAHVPVTRAAGRGVGCWLHCCPGSGGGHGWLDGSPAGGQVRVREEEGPRWTVGGGAGTPEPHWGVRRDAGGSALSGGQRGVDGTVLACGSAQQSRDGDVAEQGAWVGWGQGACGLCPGWGGHPLHVQPGRGRLWLRGSLGCWGGRRGGRRGRDRGTVPLLDWGLCEGCSRGPPRLMLRQSWGEARTPLRRG